ncbi:glycosyltransferase family 2 protein [Enterococcus sp. S86.2]|uniref:glycosyltransferase family 2 protein n=1 Tax=Enterococcus sp. S86.2 TaxID=3031299 RepID=UPI0026EF6D90|nr:glycosyltransferase family 2 protein [Enterococcus sp. S86.2]
MKRQFNTEKNMQPLPQQHEKASVVKVTLNRIYIILTMVFWAVYVASTIYYQITKGNGSFQKAVEAALYIIIVTTLCFSAMIYLFSRQGALLRFKAHKRIPREMLDSYFAKNQSDITVLVPSYDEEVTVIRQTLLSAALQEYPKVLVRLLIDDKPNPSTPEAAAKLQQTKQLARDINQLLAKPHQRFKKALEQFKAGQQPNFIKNQELLKVVAEYHFAVKWLQNFAASEPHEDHVDDFFVNHVILDLAEELAITAKAVEKVVEEKSQLPVERVEQLYCRLTWIFGAEVDYFQRKEYISLSHEANKAMNLNSYIDLMGKNYQVKKTEVGKVLLPVAPAQKADFVVPDSEFLLTLDADSLLLREYCLRLVYLLNQPGNEKIAVTQTPYSSFRGCPSRIERIAGATTDIQHILHQGTTHYGATFWVGSNAVIRKCALEDIAETEIVQGFPVRRFIQDRTVIEDTESSVDLEKHGWELYNYPERLSYSATPPDFGSLIIQRRRWANGGLLILPKLFATIKERRQQGNPLKMMEIFMRLNYMASIAWASFGLIFLLAYPFDDNLLSVYIICAAAPYFIAMASDLHYCRYKRLDILRIYGFNLILLAVNLAGVVKSIQQYLTGEKIPFARTPKVNDRTASPTLYLLAPLVIITFSAFICWRSYTAGNFPNAIFAGFNAFTASWAALAYIGIKNTIVDFVCNFINWLFVDVKTKDAGEDRKKEELNWRSVLYYGDDSEQVPLSVALGQSVTPQEEK